MLSFATDKFRSIDCSDFEFDASFGFSAGALPGVDGEVFLASAPEGDGACPALAGGVAPVFLAGLAVPRVEKFHFPERLRNRLTWGWDSVS